MDEVPSLQQIAKYFFSKKSISHRFCVVTPFLLDKLLLDMDASPSLQNGLRVLVVDSELDSCELLASIFAQYGVETIIANCASEAIEKIHLFHPDFLISEIILPHEDGYSLIQQVKNFEAASGIQIPAIALTVCREEHERVRALTAGFCRHLAKPVDIDELIETVASLTEQAQTISPPRP